MRSLAKWSIEDYHRLIAASILPGDNIELLEGDIINLSPEGPLHAFVTVEIANYLRNLLLGLAHIREAHPITLDRSNSEPEPDIAIVRLPISLYRQRHPSVEDIFWLIEVSQSSIDYDLEDKKRVYARSGIGEYWIVDLNCQQVNIFRSPTQEDYQDLSLVTTGIIAPLAFPSLEVRVDGFF